MEGQGEAPANAEAREIAPGVMLRMPKALGAAADPPSSLPSLNVSGLRGAELVLREGAKSPDGLIFRTACVRAPSSLWAPGLEELAFGQATGLSVGALGREGLSLIHLEGKAISHQGSGQDIYIQDLWGSARAADADIFIHGRHILAFSGEARDALLCTHLCRSKQPSACAEPIAESSLLGSGLRAEPTPQAWIQILLLSAEYPRRAAAVFTFMALLIVFIVLMRRPHPKRYAPPKKAL